MDDKTELHCAIKDRKGDLVELLLNNNNVDVNATDKYGKTPLHCLADIPDDFPRQVQLAKWIIDRGANINAEDFDGSTPLHLAIKVRNEDLIQLLLDNNVNVSVKNMYGSTPLHYIVKSVNFPCQLQITQCIIDRGADINAEDRLGRTPLHWAVLHKREDLLNLLLDNSCDVNVEDNEGKTPLMNIINLRTQYALRLVPFARRFIDRGADINTQDENGLTPLHMAIEAGIENLIDLLLENNVNVKVKTKIGETPLHSIAKKSSHFRSQVEVAKCLIDRGADINAQDMAGSTPLHFAIKARKSVLIELLLDNNVDVSVQNKYDMTPLHYIANKFLNFPLLPQIAKRIIDRGVDVNAKDTNKLTPLHLAIKAKNVVVIDLLLYNNVDVSVKDTFDSTPLHYIADISANFPQMVEVAKCLIERGADVNAQDRDRRTPLHLAIKASGGHLAQLLLDNNANAIDKDIFHNTPLHYAVAISNNFPCQVEVVKCLIGRGADTNARDTLNRTPLHLAMQARKGDLAQLLLENNANVLARDHQGCTALHTALYNFKENDENDYFFPLLYWGGSMFVKNNAGQTPNDYVSGDHLVLDWVKDYNAIVNCAGLKVDIEIIDIDDNKSSNILKDLREELEKMKLEKYGRNTVYDVFCKYQDPLYVTNRELEDAVHCQQMKLEYVRYGGLLHATFAKAKTRLVLLNRAVECFAVVDIPDETKRKILSYLASEDMKSLITSYETTEGQNHS